MKLFATFILVLLTTPSLSAQSGEALQNELNAHTTTVGSWSAEPAILDAVRAQNAEELSLSDIRREDASWVAGENETLVKQMISGPCADRLRELALEAGFAESFVMDNQGALVCATGKTSDYWQGDEAKWIRAFDKGQGATYVDRPRLDGSTNEYLAQISVPILDEGRAIGVITAGVLWKPAAARR